MSNSTWNKQATTGVWNTGTNWDPSTVPDGTATFATSSQTSITFTKSSTATVEEIEFSEQAGSFTFTVTVFADTPALTITGKGITNSSTSAQSIKVASLGNSGNPQILFKNSATAGNEDMNYYAGPESLDNSYGGGIIGFGDTASAGSASFVVRTGKLSCKGKVSTVGGEVSFSSSATANKANFTIYGTLGTDGDTFANAVFHDTSTADQATFTNAGGTVPGGDGGNTQFYDSASAANGEYYNIGGTAYGTVIEHGKKSEQGANGGDVTFDTESTAANGHFHNYAATKAGAYGGVVSFNNNWPPTKALNKGSNAGNGIFVNSGARNQSDGGGGHTEFTAIWGSPTAKNGVFVNYGSVLQSSSSAGHTVFSVTYPRNKHVELNHFPSAGNATFWNHPAEASDGAGGYTKFTVYLPKDTPPSVEHGIPTAENGVFHNLGAFIANAAGGSTVFEGNTNADNATLIAYGGTNGGKGGKIAFEDDSTGGTSSIQLFGNSELDLGYHTGGLSIGSLELAGGTINMQLGGNITNLTSKDPLQLKSTPAMFNFWAEKDNFSFNTSYVVLTAPNLDAFTSNQFKSNSVEGVDPTFTVSGNELQVSFNKS